jgi:hypothetical protein
MKALTLYVALLLSLAIPAYSQQSPAEYRRYFISRYGMDGWKYDSTQKVAKRQFAYRDSIRKARIKHISDSAIAAQARTAPSTNELNRAVMARTKVPGYAQRVPPVVGKPVATRKASSGPIAYYCASGNTVKYHSSATCRGLSRCQANIQKMSLAEARQSMAPCSYCH